MLITTNQDCIFLQSSNYFSIFHETSVMWKKQSESSLEICVCSTPVNIFFCCSPISRCKNMSRLVSYGFAELFHLMLLLLLLLIAKFEDFELLISKLMTGALLLTHLKMCLQRSVDNFFSKQMYIHIYAEVVTFEAV